jgi:hypothetical protein
MANEHRVYWRDSAYICAIRYLSVRGVFQRLPNALLGVATLGFFFLTTHWFWSRHPVLCDCSLRWELPFLLPPSVHSLRFHGSRRALLVVLLLRRNLGIVRRSVGDGEVTRVRRLYRLESQVVCSNCRNRLVERAARLKRSQMLSPGRFPISH